MAGRMNRGSDGSLSPSRKRTSAGTNDVPSAPSGRDQGKPVVGDALCRKMGIEVTIEAITVLMLGKGDQWLLQLSGAEHEEAVHLVQRDEL